MTDNAIGRHAWLADVIVVRPGVMIEGGLLVSDGPEIIYVGPADRGDARQFLADRGVQVHSAAGTAIFPGLVNAHVHLELSRLPAIDAVKGDFGAWIETVGLRMRDAFGGGDAGPSAAEQATAKSFFRESAETGLASLIRDGMTTAGDISLSGESAAAMAEAGVGGVVFHEALGWQPSRAAEAVESVIRRIAGGRTAAPGLVHGLSPHSPYAVSEPLAQQLAALARQQGLRCAIHLAETLEELEFLEFGEGSLVEWHRRRGRWDDAWKAPGTTPLEWAEASGLLDTRPLLIHANYLDAATPRGLARLREQIAGVVFCPRSHEFFDHAQHPLPKLFSARIPIGIGTDSAASNPEFSIRNELRLLANGGVGFDALPLEVVLSMGTLTGAHVLGLDRITGSLEPGKRADWIQVAKGVGSNPLYWLFDTHLPVLRTVAGGRELFSAFAEHEAAAEEEARRRALERGASAWPEQEGASEEPDPFAPDGEAEITEDDGDEEPGEE